MKGKDENKEIQSRREFFKSAAKKVLPILGAVTLPQILFSKNIKEESLETDCNWGCSSGCKGGCGRVCSYNCTNSCAGGGAMEAAKAIVWVLVKDHVIEIIVIDFNEHNQRA